MGQSIKGLYAIVDSESLALDCAQGGVSVIQLRDKRRKESEESFARFKKTAAYIRSLKKEYDFTFILNDEPEVALAVEADGVHVGRDDPSIEVCRRILGDQKLIGYSSHSLEEALQAEIDGADYIAFGAIFPTTNKGPDHPIQGLDRLRELVSRVRKPVVAIGGIDEGNIKDVMATGVASVAMIRAIADIQLREERIEKIAKLLKLSRFY